MTAPSPTTPDIIDPAAMAHVLRRAATMTDRPVTPQSRLSDLGLDMWDLVELELALEDAFGCDVDCDDPDPTLAQIAGEVSRSAQTEKEGTA